MEHDAIRDKKYVGWIEHGKVRRSVKEMTIESGRHNDRVGGRDVPGSMNAIVSTSSDTTLVRY